MNKKEEAIYQEKLAEAQATRVLDLNEPSGPANPEPMPIKGKEFVLPHVVNDLMQRDQLGKEKYGTSLETHNGRSSLWDAYQEALDFIIYFRKHLLELEDKKKEAE